MEDQNEMALAIGIFMIMEGEWQVLIHVGCKVMQHF